MLTFRVEDATHEITVAKAEELMASGALVREHDGDADLTLSPDHVYTHDEVVKLLTACEESLTS